MHIDQSICFLEGYIYYACKLSIVGQQAKRELHFYQGICFLQSHKYVNANQLQVMKMSPPGSGKYTSHAIILLNKKSISHQ